MPSYNQHEFNFCPPPLVPQVPDMRQLDGKYHCNHFIDWRLKLETPESMAMRATDLWPYQPPTKTGRPGNWQQARSLASKHRNAKAGLLRLEPPLAPSVRPRTQEQPPEGKPETMPGAKNQDTLAGEEEVPVSSIYRSRTPRLAEWSLGVRYPTPSPKRVAWSSNTPRSVYGSRDTKAPHRCRRNPGR